MPTDAPTTEPEGRRWQRYYHSQVIQTVPWHYIDVRRGGAQAPDGYPPEAGERTTVMGLWLYYVLANLRIDCVAFAKVSVAENEFGRLLPSAFLQGFSPLPGF